MRIFIFSAFITWGLYAKVVVIGPVFLPFDKLSETEIQHLFMGKTETVHDVQVIPKDNEDAKLYKEFCENILDKSTHQVRSYWARMIFTGQQKSPALTSADKLEDERNAQPPVITYVRPSEVREGWKILYETVK